MSPVIIRPAAVEDVSSIVRVRLGAITEQEIKGFSALEFALYSSIEKLRINWDKGNRLRDGFEVFVAEAEGKLVGFIAFKMERNCGYIDNIVVAKERQRQGIGRKLVAHVEMSAKSQGIDQIITDTTENADGTPWRSYNFWIKLGYKDTGERLPTKYDFKEIPLIKRLI
jgi:ribosomal protein S18 acetylase RimI-like enzyme